MRECWCWLKLTGQAEENQPVYNEDRPEDGQVEDLEPTAEKSDSDGLGRRVPELELWETAHERPELLVLLGREAARVSVLHTLILLQRGVKLGRKEGEEEVEQIDAERVGDDVPALSKEDAQAKQEEKHTGANPPVGVVGCGLVEIRLEHLLCVSCRSFVLFGASKLWTCREKSKCARPWTYPAILCCLRCDSRERGIGLRGIHRCGVLLERVERLNSGGRVQERRGDKRG